MSSKILYDGENIPFEIRESKYLGKTVTFPKEFLHMSQTLESLESFEPMEDDIWILTYPKSGTHWLFEIIGILLAGKLKPLEQYQISAFVEMKSNIMEIPQLYGRRVFTTHFRKELLPKGVTKKSKVIYVARNPKSVAVSWCKMATSSHYNGTLNGFLSLYLNGHYNVYGNWFEHIPEYWQESRNNHNMMFLCYEELTKEPGKYIHQLSQFLGLDHTETFCEKVAEVASTENMRKGNGKSEEQMQFYQKLFKDGKNKMIGEGKIDGWKNMFTVAQNEMFDQIYEEKMKEHTELKNRIYFS